MSEDLKAMHENPAMYRRKQLLARMAGNIAAGAVSQHYPSGRELADEVAELSVDVAERILQRIGL